ncbi:hypothetical protein BN946_scf184844.g108 [Trametes cinnabarina]|uniref:DUF6533 domain-containing protein n=1 Tax=Pycnoporus cinnabarinus TaxID=5643 RepID=A0A060SFR8_PYCCI|nr:hypothetical protein BN946_scf184844.g108 [Trametes cinnabarina]
MSTLSAVEQASIIVSAYARRLPPNALHVLKEIVIRIPENRVALGAVALLAYEYAITLGQEVRFIWMHKKTGAVWLFLVVRYHALLSMVLLESISYSYSPIPDHVPQAALQVAQYIIWAAFSGLRALALSGMNWPLAPVVFLLAAAPFAVNLWVIGGIGTYAYNIPLAGCLTVTNETASQAKMQVPADALRPDTRSLRDVGGLERSLTQVLVLNDGVADQISEVAVFIDPLTAILICRFLLALHSANLRLTGEEALSENADARGRVGSTLRFASFVESMAGVVGAEDSTAGLGVHGEGCDAELEEA